MRFITPLLTDPVENHLGLLKYMSRSFLLVVALFCLSGDLSAQQPDSGVVEISIRESMDMVDGFRVQWNDKIASTDSSGHARLTLPVGRQTLTITRIGYKKTQASILVLRDSVVSLTVEVAMNEEAMRLEDMRVTSTRTERLAGETPIRLERA